MLWRRIAPLSASSTKPWTPMAASLPLGDSQLSLGNHFPILAWWIWSIDWELPPCRRDWTISYIWKYEFVYTFFSRFLQYKELEHEPSLWLSVLGGEAFWFWCSWSPWFISSFISWILVAASLLRFYINLNLETEIPLTSLSCSDKKPFSELWTHSMRFKEKASDTDSYTLKL